MHPLTGEVNILKHDTRTHIDTHRHTHTHTRARTHNHDRPRLDLAGHALDKVDDMCFKSDEVVSEEVYILI